jgi:methylthioribose-1-phosphate isomerase
LSICGDVATYLEALAANDNTVRVTPQASPAANYAFDVTPARLVTALVTERGVCRPRAGLLDLLPERGR